MELGALSPYNAPSAKLIQLFENIAIENVAEYIVPPVLFLGCCNTQCCPSGSTAYLRRRLLMSTYLARICSAICSRRAYLRNPTIVQTYCSIHVPCIKVFQSILVFATIWFCHMKVQTLSLDALPQLCPPPPITRTVSHTVCIKAPSLVLGS